YERVDTDEAVGDSRRHRQHRGAAVLERGGVDHGSGDLRRRGSIVDESRTPARNSVPIETQGRDRIHPGPPRHSTPPWGPVLAGARCPVRNLTWLPGWRWDRAP